MASEQIQDEQLVHNVLQAERDLVDARFLHSQGTLENTAKLGRLRKEIARLKTEARNREIAQGLRRDGLIAKYSGSFQKPAKGGAPAAKEETGGFLAGIVDRLTSKE